MRAMAAMLSTVALIAASCGGGSTAQNDAVDGVDTGAVAQDDGALAASDPSEDNGAATQADGGDVGTLVLDGETIAFDSARCFLQEQDAAAGGGKILFVAQAFGVTEGGEQVTIDISRYDEDSQFTGDGVIIDIGDPFSDQAVSMNASTDLGTVTVDGSTLSAGDLVFLNSSDLSEQSGSFRINC